MSCNLVSRLSQETCGSGGSLDGFKFPDLLTSLLVFMSAPVSDVDAFFTNLSLEPTWRWYFAMTPFETVFLFLVIGQFAVLNTLGIMPMNLSNLINGMPSGRKKREIADITGKRKQLGSEILKLIKRLDPNECTFRAICELQSRSLQNSDLNLSKETKLAFSSLKRSADKRQRKSGWLSDTEDVNEKRAANAADNDDIVLFESAVLTGYNSHANGNNSLCYQRYHYCPVTSNEILEFIDIVGTNSFSL